jgi:G3E family GTPase
MHDLSDIASVGVVAYGPLDEYRFNMFMRDLLTERAADIFRCKGMLAIQGYGDTRFVFQVRGGQALVLCSCPSGPQRGVCAELRVSLPP